MPMCVIGLRFGVSLLLGVLAAGSAAQAATLDCRRPISPAVLRNEIIQHVVNSEALRDDDGRIAVFHPPSGDGGGRFEVAGINHRYHPDMATHLRDIIAEGEQVRAEAEAVAYIAEYTDPLGSLAKTGAIEFLLRDIMWHRGPTGATRILQIALRVTEDGFFGPQTHNALMQAERAPVKLMDALRVAREVYERRRRDESSQFWNGLVNRWNAASEQALCYL